ncbi:hypothetical protein B5X24_HaOG213267 [Helicoverpa armigera]|nr:hypothetical protein B5X24_HaOG213267 [Helicoverpa armigera]
MEPKIDTEYLQNLMNACAQVERISIIRHGSPRDTEIPKAYQVRRLLQRKTKFTSKSERRKASLLKVFTFPEGINMEVLG